MKDIHQQIRAHCPTGRSILFLALLLSACFHHCSQDDTIAPEGQHEEEQQNEAPQFELLDQSPTLPDVLYRYADLPLPAHFLTGPVPGQDNTPPGNRVTDEGATLGRVLFYDRHLSANNTVSCGSCHTQADGFSDRSALSTGFEGGLTRRNSMGLTNAAYYARGHFFWDERAETLEQQVLMPIQDDTEMGLSLDDLVAKLSEAGYYAPLFQDAFGDTEVTSERIALALAQFVRSMVSYRSKFDEGMVLTGNDPEFPLIDFPNYTQEENAGKRLFFSPLTNCAACHGTVNFAAPEPRNNGLSLNYADNGLGEITGNIRDNALFKVNSLRNIALTAPYMHDGRFSSLEQVMDHYSTGVRAHPNLSPQLHDQPPGEPIVARQLNLTFEARSAIIAFLQTLTDEEFLADPKFSDPF